MNGLIGAAFEPLLVVDDGQLEAHPALGLGPALLASVVVAPHVVGNSPTWEKAKYLIGVILDPVLCSCF